VTPLLLLVAFLPITKMYIAIDENTSGSKRGCTCIGSLGNATTNRISSRAKVNAATVVLLAFLWMTHLQSNLVKNTSDSNRGCTGLGPRGSTQINGIVSFCWHPTQGAKVSDTTVATASIFVDGLKQI
jgi:hypothetical protein